MPGRRKTQPSAGLRSMPSAPAEAPGLLTALSGDWGQRAIAVRTPYGPPTPRHQLLAGANAVALAAALAVIAGGTWASLSSQPTAQPASTPNPSFDLYTVNSGGTSVDPDRCGDSCRRVRPDPGDWGEDFLTQECSTSISPATQTPMLLTFGLACRPIALCMFGIVPVSSSAGRVSSPRSPPIFHR